MNADGGEEDLTQRLKGSKGGIGDVGDPAYGSPPLCLRAFELKRLLVISYDGHSKTNR